MSRQQFEHLSQHSVRMRHGLISPVCSVVYGQFNCNKQVVIRPSYSAVYGTAVKVGIELTANEIKRQADLIDRYLEHEQNTIALGLMRESVVSLGAFHHGNKDKRHDRNERQKTERALSALVNELKRGDGLGSAREISQKEWGGFWNRLRDQRNQIAHNGMTVNQSKICLDGIQTFWEQIKGGDSCWQPPRRSEEHTSELQSRGHLVCRLLLEKK